ncbi:SUKH-4 family immunity protein [Kitasatospora aureofaciens]|uniref:SUKH-4 family immunity protein n=1 Tax=Kitasatospora aureofaciens TaxID=1894 RepID=UPI001C44D235|nr:SUKH-4 family immunity protein [Kitasatospora aureofaciens]MBV6697743.1 SUKH-4 family immunity protein [Kitasatospora aureofaciens]
MTASASVPGTDLSAVTRNPTAEWLESHFGQGTLWRPSPESLPEGLEDAETRAFLTEIGIPAVHNAFTGFDGESLPERGLWEADPDEIFGRRYPDDDTPPDGYAYCVGLVNELHLMVDGVCGSVEAYDPNGWDHAAGHAGYVAESVPQALAAFAVLARYEERFDDGDATALAEFTGLLEQLGLDLDEYDFWQNVVDELREGYLDLD